MDPALEIEIAAMSHQKAMNEALKKGGSDIQNFYANTTIFITGGTGFMGKHLIEKLFRSCKITKIYLLIRSKKGKTIKERLEEMLEDPVFATLQTSQPGFLSRLVCVEGDASEIKLGISEKDWQMLVDEVDVIFHCAATTRFDEKLRTAVRINVRGTRETLLLARAARHLRSFVHVSTAYSQATVKSIDQDIYEKFYPTPISPEALLNLVEEHDEQHLDAITPDLIKNWANTYVYCKAVAEDVIRAMSEGLPVCVIRPGIVIGSYSEPVPGWIDRSAVYSATGVIIGIGLGVLHVLINDPQKKVGLVPCDYVNNAIIAAGRETSCKQKKGGDDTSIYHVTTTARNCVTWKTLSYILYNECVSIPSPVAVYYNYAFETSSLLLYKILTLFLQTMPAHIIDFICLVLRRKRIFVKLSKKVEKMMISFSFFCINEWTFVDDNTDKLYKNLSKQDKLIYNFDINKINWTEFILIWGMGIRKYILKDGLKSTDYAIKKQLLFKLLHYFLTCGYFYILWQIGLVVYCVLRNLISLIF